MRLKTPLPMQARSDQAAPGPAPASLVLPACLPQSDETRGAVVLHLQTQCRVPTCASSWPSHRLPITAGKPPSIALYTPAYGSSRQARVLIPVRQAVSPAVQRALCFCCLPTNTQ